ncbi:unnamed protein product [Ceutorhynchus assimilis]|uniref:RRM domain-containing protein n=1 Tax=Ceutorhynchus assimilis TaxID=467358 RepID=A0A9N9QRV4_9CUCU|nr:unnamed protein product [Ceutorhynchus assimilis]
MAKQTSNRGSKNRQQQSRPNRSNNANKLNSNAKFKKRPASTGKGRVQDARQKITQKKRNVVDARDVLAKKAKTQDARSKLDKIRHSQSPKPNSNIKMIGNSIVQKVDRDGKISLVTNKSKNTLQMDMAIKKQLGLIPQSRPPLKRSPPKKPVNIRPTIRRNIAEERYAGPRIVPAVLPRSRVQDSGMYKWLKPAFRPTTDLDTARQAMRDVVREELMLANRGWPSFPAPRPIRSSVDHPRPPIRPASRYIDLDAVVEDEEMPMVRNEVSRIALRGSTRVSNVHSRLDGAPSQPKSHGILAGEMSTKVVVPNGHRIVVSNLESSVTEEDIKELFEDVGQLLSAKLARPGVAEVIFKNLKDAQKAVDTYHNRQLDGQPMKCLLVNKRPLHQPTARPLIKSGGMSISSRISSASSNASKLVPDLGTIHKVLFQRH